MTCSDSAATYGGNIAVADSGSAYVAYFSEEGQGSVIISHIGRDYGGDGAVWAARRIGAVHASPNGGWQIVPDGTGGAYLAWVTGAAGSMTSHLLRITPSGAAPGWPDTGVACLGPVTYLQVSDLALSDDGGCVVLLSGFFDLSNRLLCQRLTRDGLSPSGWPAQGIQLSTDYSGVVGAGRLGAMRNGRAPVVWTESPTMDDLTPYVRLAFVSPTGLVTVNGNDQTYACLEGPGNSKAAVARMDEDRSAVVWIQATTLAADEVRIAAFGDDLAVPAAASLTGSAVCTEDGIELTWLGDRLSGRDLEVRQSSDQGWVSRSGYIVGGGQTTLSHFCPNDQAGGGRPCFELAERGLAVPDSRICADCSPPPGATPWRMSIDRAGGAPSVRYVALSRIDLRVCLFDVQGRLLTVEQRGLHAGETLTIDASRLGLASGWYRLQASDGKATAGTTFIVIH